MALMWVGAPLPEDQFSCSRSWGEVCREAPRAYGSMKWVKQAA